MQEKNILEEIIVNRLTRIAGLKCVGIPLDTFKIWNEQIERDLEVGNISSLDCVDKGFNNLLKEKSYGGLDYAVFFEGAKRTRSETNLMKEEDCV